MIYLKKNIFKSGLAAMSLSALFLVTSCNPPASENEDKTDSTEVGSAKVADDQADAHMSSTGMRDKTIEKYAAKYPELQYTYVETEDGELATSKGNYKLKVEGIEDEKDLQDFVTYVEQAYATNKEMRGKFNQSIEETATPKNGYNAYYNALEENTEYPDEALAEDVGGTVFVEFVIDENGQVTNVTPQEGMYYTRNRQYMDQLDQAAVEAIKTTDWNWVPAKQGNQPVKMKMEIPITFDPNT